MNFWTKACAVVALALSAQAGHAQTYACNVEKQSGRGGVSDVIMVKIDKQSDSASVKDDFTQQLTDGYLWANLSMGDRFAKVDWTLIGVEIDSKLKTQTSLTLIYRLRLNLRNKSFSLDATTGESAFPISGTGTCVPQ